MTFDRTLGRIAAVALVLLLCSPLVFLGSSAGAQETSAPTTQALAAQASPGESDEGRQTIADIRSYSAAIRLASYLSVAVGLAVALAVFVYRRRRFMTFSKTWGAAAAVIVSIALFSISSSLLTSSAGAECASAALKTGAKAEEYDDICRTSREAATNAFGLTSAYRAMFVSDGSGYIVPVGAAVLKFLTYLSVLVTALIGFFILRPLAESLFVRT